MLNLLFPFMWIHWACLFAIIEVYNHKIIPVFLTTLSTVLGLVPFLIDGSEDEAFWFSFAIGKSGGLLFSILASIFVMPIFMPLKQQVKKKAVL